MPRAFVRRQVRRVEGAEDRRFVPAELGARRRDDLRDAARPHEGLPGQEQDQFLYHQRHEDRRRAGSGFAYEHHHAVGFLQDRQCHSVRQGRRGDEESHSEILRQEGRGHRQHELRGRRRRRQRRGEGRGSGRVGEYRREGGGAHGRCRASRLREEDRRPDQRPERRPAARFGLQRS